MMRPEEFCALWEIFGARLYGIELNNLLHESPRGVRDTLHIATKFSGSHAIPETTISFERKFRRGRRVARLLSFLPFVRAVALCNSMGLQTVHEKSDIDIVIVATRGRAWSARLWVVGALSLLRLRHGIARRDPVCASFFIDESVFCLRRVAFEHDLYLSAWLKTLTPLFGEMYIGSTRSTPHELRVDSALARNFQRFFELFAVVLSEARVRAWEMSRMPICVRESAGKSESYVVLSHNMIKLHVNDRRQYFRDAVFERCALSAIT